VTKSSSSVEIAIDTNDASTQRLLSRLPLELRAKYLTAGIRAAGRVVVKAAKTYLPAPGYPGDKPGKPALAETINVAVRSYDELIYAAVGPEYPSGAHGHLVESGHDMVLWGQETNRRVEPRPFMEPAADATLAQQKQAIEKAVQRGINKVIRESGIPQPAGGERKRNAKGQFI